MREISFSPNFMHVLTWKRGSLLTTVCDNSYVLPIISLALNLNHISKSFIYTTFYLRAIHVAAKSTRLWLTLVCLAFKLLISNVNRQKANLFNMDTLYVDYFTVPLQSYSLHCFLLSHWCRSYHGGYYMLHRLPCRSKLLRKQVLCCHRSSFASR